MAICEGVGDIVTPIDCKDELFGVIIYCGLKASTGGIFGALSKKYNQPKLDYSAKTIDYQNIIDIIKNNGNDLTNPAILFSQSIARVLSFIGNTNLSVVSGMSGAGPTCFSICKSQSDAEKLVFNLRSEFGNFFTKKVKFLSRIDFETILPTLQPTYGSINLVKNPDQYNMEC
jgi:4-diphosphocytidyl-2-C-methyl-D-erythritol kinase